jgi:hypothetical protein
VEATPCNDSRDFNFRSITKTLSVDLCLKSLFDQ